MAEANALQSIAAMGVEPVENYRKAIACYAHALPSFPAGLFDAGMCQMNEAIARIRLAEIDVDPVANCRKAIALCTQACRCFDAGSLNVGRCQTSEASAWQRLAAVGVDPVANYKKALKLHEEAMPCFVSDRFSRAIEGHNFAGVLKGMAFLISDRQEKHKLLGNALALLRDDSLPTLEQIGRTVCNEAERRSFRETYQMVYQRIVSICLELATIETNLEQAEALRWEAWEWVQRSKAGTMQESMAAFQDEMQKHDQTVPPEFLELMREQSELDRRNPKDPGTRSGGHDPMLTSDVQERIERFLAQLIEQARQQPIKVEAVSKEAQAMALPRLARSDRPMVVVEFFTADAGRIGAFVHLAGQTSGLHEPQWLDGGQTEATRLAKDCAAATDVLRKCRRYRARDRSLNTDEPTESETVAAGKKLPSVAAGLGVLLAPVREFIEEQGWQDATLLLCPSGTLHLLPLAAAHWGANSQGKSQCLIEAHALIHLPTAALACQVIERQRPESDAPRRAYIAAADPWDKLSAIYHEANDASAKLRTKGFIVEHCQGEAATTVSLYEHGGQADVVHLAMHSHMDERRFELCGAEFHDRRFAGLELLRWLRFKQAQLAIIATCSSGQAIDLNADDPSAITRAWMLAGAPSIIGGLWPLADQPAFMFSGEFYRQWAKEDEKGQPLAEAMREAILHVRKQDPDDLFAWAPYILVGNGATVI